MVIHQTISDFIFHIFAAGLLGSIIGLERQFHQGMAGLRTNALVAVAASAFVSLPSILAEDGTGPAHMATFVMTGIGFLGGGVIFKEANNIKGLNTAATLWATGAVGAFSGAGLIVYASIIMLAILVINLLMRPVSNLVQIIMERHGAGNPIAYTIEVVCNTRAQKFVRTRLADGFDKQKVGVHSLSTKNDSDNNNIIKAEVVAYGGKVQPIEILVAQLWAIPEVMSAKWNITIPEADSKMNQNV